MVLCYTKYLYICRREFFEKQIMETTFQQTQDKAKYRNQSVAQTRHSYPSRTVVHAKLEMTGPGDYDELEADAVANDIVSGGKIRRQISNGGGSGIAVSPQMERQIAQLQGGGHAMPDGLRHMMENGFGRDFSQVRLHTDSQAADMSSSISARAFTHGNDIYFNRGQYSPNTSEGQRLVAHELTHVAQGTGKVGRETPNKNSCEEDLLKHQIIQKMFLEQHDQGTSSAMVPVIINGGSAAAGAALGAAFTSWSGPGAIVGAAIGAAIGAIGTSIFNEVNDIDNPVLLENYRKALYDELKHNCNLNPDEIPIPKTIKNRDTIQEQIEDFVETCNEDSYIYKGIPFNGEGYAYIDDELSVVQYYLGAVLDHKKADSDKHIELLEKICDNPIPRWKTNPNEHWMWQQNYIPVK